MRQISNSLPPGIALVSADNLEEWFLDIAVLDQNPIYAGDTYRLKFKFSKQYPIGMCGSPSGAQKRICAVRDLTRYRTPRGCLRQARRSAHTDAPAHLFERHHLSRPAGQPGLESGAERGERVHEHPKHADRQHQERATPGRRRLRAPKPPTAPGYRLLLPRQHRLSRWRKLGPSASSAHP